MFLKLARRKKKHFLLSLFYKVDRILPLSKERRLKLYLDLAWIFERLAHERSSQVSKDYSVLAESFEFLKSKLERKFRVLDLGCHAGLITSMIAANTNNVVGIDHNNDHILQARQNYKQDNIQFIHGEALQYLHQNKQSFDVLILSHIVEHLDDPEPFLLNFRKYFSYIYIEVPDFEKTHLNVYRHELGCDLVYSDNDHTWEFDRVAMTDLIKKTGLEIVNEEYRFGVQKFWCRVIS